MFLCFLAGCVIFCTSFGPVSFSTFFASRWAAQPSLVQSGKVIGETAGEDEAPAPNDELEHEGLEEDEEGLDDPRRNCANAIFLRSATETTPAPEGPMVIRRICW